MKRFWWFQGTSVDQITAELIAAGPGARLEVRPDGDQCTIHVIPVVQTAEGGGGGTNDSHVCPPQCP